MTSSLVLVALLGGSTLAAEPTLAYPVVHTGQTRCYDDRSEIDPPKPGQPFSGQDGQRQRALPSYKLSADGLTVYDNHTRLTWQRGPDTNGDGLLTGDDKLTWAQAQKLPGRLNAARYGGFSDWRLPTIKELYSLIVFSGVDPSGPAAEAGRLTPFIDTRFFQFVYGDTNQGERIIDSQYASSTLYSSPSLRESVKLFGVNFADGRIKGYGSRRPGTESDKTFFVQCVRGNPNYGKNDFVDHGDGTITDRATGLMWSKVDSGKGMNWKAALAWVQAKNAQKHLGYSDWRLPHAKELQSIVDYARSPDATNSAAIDPLLRCTQITNEIKQIDYPYYWTSTTHAATIGGRNAVYIAFGRAAGWPTGRGVQGGGAAGGRPGPDRPGAGSGGPYMDVHGAGSQRSDPKAGDPSAFPRGRGPQGDVVRILNYVRLVRGGLQ